MAFCVAAIALAIAYAAPELVQRQIDRMGATEGEDETARPISVSSAQSTTSKPILNGWDRRHVMNADTSGHYRDTFRLNGKPLQAMIDTGATHVAINQSMARQLGLQLIPADFSQEVQTANGVALVALSTLHSVEIGPIRRENVPVVVMPDRALTTPLIGMSFLGQLKFQMSAGTLELQG
ncbi:retropepsin-like aspartic protease family protein [Notoacmeibacter ruber]|nr:TIGR02281 family clan AA aspartic protease [Notoacmeibacter ruber]